MGRFGDVEPVHPDPGAALRAAGRQTKRTAQVPGPDLQGRRPPLRASVAGAGGDQLRRDGLRRGRELLIGGRDGLDAIHARHLAGYGESIDIRGHVMAHIAANPWNPRDAIFSAARYLVANGAHRDLPQAIFAYNHATWYVQEVLSVAQQIDQQGMKPGATDGKRVEAMRTMAGLLNGMPYVWGGGHSSWEMATGYDCSGFVSQVLHAGGYLSQPVSTQSLPFCSGSDWVVTGATGNRRRGAPGRRTQSSHTLRMPQLECPPPQM